MDEVTYSDVEVLKEGKEEA